MIRSSKSAIGRSLIFKAVTSSSPDFVADECSDHAADGAQDCTEYQRLICCDAKATATKTAGDNAGNQWNRRGSF